MAVDSDYINMCHLGRALIHLSGQIDIYTKLVFFQTRGYVGMGLSIHIWVDPQRHGRDCVTAGCSAV